MQQKQQLIYNNHEIKQNSKQTIIQLSVTVT